MEDLLCRAGGFVIKRSLPEERDAAVHDALLIQSQWRLCRESVLVLPLVVSLRVPLRVSLMLPDAVGRQHVSGGISALRAGGAGHGPLTLQHRSSPGMGSAASPVPQRRSNLIGFCMCNENRIPFALLPSRVCHPTRGGGRRVPAPSEPPEGRWVPSPQS